MKRSDFFQKGFTLLEILLVVAALGILAGITILALNPSKQLGETNNGQRRVDTNTILNAVYQYSLDNSGDLSALNGGTGISADACSTATNEICITGGDCTGLVDLSSLTTAETYLVSIPTDPTGASTNGSGYHIAQTANGRIEVCAPNAQEGATISVIR